MRNKRSIIAICFLILFLIQGGGGEIATSQNKSGKPRSPLSEEKKRGDFYPMVNITGTPYFKTTPAFSPDGGKIAYSAYVDGKQGIWIMSIEEGESNSSVLTDVVAGVHPSWSPDGKRLVFHALTESREPPYFKSEIFIVDVEEKKPQPIGEGYNPSWSPKGDKIAYVYQRNLWVMDVNGENKERLTEKGYNDYPSWSPDGKKLVFFSDNDIKILDLQTKKITSLTNSDWNGYPSWSPKGDKIVFVSTRDKLSEEKSSSRQYDLWIMNPDGTNLQPLTNNKFRESFPSWSPDGKSIAFQLDKGGNFDIWVLDLMKKEGERKG